MLIAVSRTRYPCGIDVPKGHYPAGYGIQEDQRAIHERTKKTVIVQPAYEVMSATSMLQRKWSTDAHFVNYVIHDTSDRPLRQQYRVNKDGVEWAQAHIGKLWFQTLTFDYDLEQHRKWENDDEAREFVRWCGEIVPTSMIYATSGGCRIIQPLTERVPFEKAESALVWWYEELIKRGIHPDHKCLDWTHLFRAANVRREGAKGQPSFQYQSPAIKMTSRPVEPQFSKTQPFVKRTRVKNPKVLLAAMPASPPSRQTCLWTFSGRPTGSVQRSGSMRWATGTASLSR